MNEAQRSAESGDEGANLTVLLCLWIHGTAGEPEKPCGEVDVVEFTGERIRVEFIESVMREADSGDIMGYLGGLPTECWLDVTVRPFGGEDGWSFNVLDYKESDT
jgi:hypothetical protein